MNKSVYIICSLLFTLIGCTEVSQPIIEVNFDHKVDSIKFNRQKDSLEIPIEFCKILDVEWDTVYIITAYAGGDMLTPIKARGFSSIKDEIEMNALSENSIQLVVVNKNNVVAHGELSDSIFNLGQQIFPDGKPKYFTKNDCNTFRMRKILNGGRGYKVSFGK